MKIKEERQGYRRKDGLCCGGWSIGTGDDGSQRGFSDGMCDRSKVKVISRPAICVIEYKLENLT